MLFNLDLTDVFIDSFSASSDRKRLIYACREVLKKEKVSFDLDFLKLPLVLKDDRSQNQVRTVLI